MKWVIHYTMFFIVIILLFVFLYMQKHQYQTAKRQKQYIVQIEQYIHNESIDEENKHPVIETHQFMDLYIPIIA